MKINIEKKKKRRKNNVLCFARLFNTLHSLEAPDTPGLFGQYLISAIYDYQSVSAKEENKGNDLLSINYKRLEASAAASAVNGPSFS